MKALAVGLSATAGFVVLFAGVGSVVSAGGSFLLPAIPWIAVAIGAALLALGVALLAGVSPRAEFALRLAPAIGREGPRGIRGYFVSGVAYGLASLSCTLPVFLGVVGGALAAGGFLAGLVQFVSYGLGMGLVLVALTLAIALLKEAALVAGLRRALPYMRVAAGVLLLAAGAYILDYWLFKGGLLVSRAATP